MADHFRIKRKITRKVTLFFLALSVIFMICLSTQAVSDSPKYTLYVNSDMDSLYPKLQAYKVLGDNMVTLVKTTTLSPLPAAHGPTGIGLDVLHKRLYVTDESVRTLRVLDATNLNFLGNIDVPDISNDDIAGLAVDQINSVLYVAERAGDEIARYDLTKDILTDPTAYLGTTVINIDSIYGLAFDDMAGELYVTNGSDTIHVYNASLVEVRAIPVPHNAMGIAVDGTNPPNVNIYTTDWNNSINKHSTDPGGDITVSGLVRPAGITVNPPTGYVYITVDDPAIKTFDNELNLVQTVYLTSGWTPTDLFVGAVVFWENPTIKIPNTVYERFGFEDWDYYWWDENGEDNYIMVKDRCYPYQGIIPGEFFEIPIVLRNFNQPPEYAKIGGFNLEVEFDYVDLTFYGAMRGGLLSARYMSENPEPGLDSIFWSWEYFSCRVLPCPLCPCCKYKILLYGQAETPDDPFRRGYCLAADPEPPEEFWYVDSATRINYGLPVDTVEIGATLVWLKFKVAHNHLLRDLKLPIVFEWEHELSPDTPYVIIEDWDCIENTMSNCDGNFLYVSKEPLQYDSTVCPGGDSIRPILDFMDGGVNICSGGSVPCIRGDINLNHIAYETADAVLFARALVFGPTAVFWYRETQVCATDVNADGRAMMLPDLIYLVLVIQGDVAPYLIKLGPSSDIANLIVSDGKITVECASPIGGLLFEFAGAVTPTLLNSDMEILAHEGKVLVWSRDGNSISAGASEILSFAGAELVSVAAVDREGRDLVTTITNKVAPSSFALYPAYPNPFNPYTNLSFSLPNATAYSMKIYNVAGQLVRSYEGMGVAGLNVITWDGRDNSSTDVASGVYFYKLVAGQHSAIKRMIMLK